MKHLILLNVFFLTFFLGCDDAGNLFTPDSASADSTPQSDSGEQVIIGIMSQPPRATVWVDGENTGQVTPADVQVMPGCHDFALTLEGYKDWEDLICAESHFAFGTVELENDPSYLADFKWLEGEWVRTDDIQSGPHEVEVSVKSLPADWAEAYPDFDAFVSGFYPSADGWPIKKTSENELMIYFESGDSLTTITSTILIGSQEIVLKEKYHDTNQTFEYIYKRP